MGALEEVQGIYGEYERKLAEAVKAASPFAGAFNMGDDPRKHPCNEIFYERLEAWAGKYAASKPDAQEAGEIMEYILEYPAVNRNGHTYWYTYAAMKHATQLVPFVSKEKAAELANIITERYAKRERLPVQQELLKALRKKAGKAAETGTETYLQKWGKRVILLLIGLTIAHLGVTLFLLADLGSDPFNVMIQGLHRMLPWTAVTHGTVHVAISLLIILALLVIDRSYVRIGTFLCMILGGPIIDMFTVLLESAVNSGSAMWIRILAVVLGCGILAFGMTIVIKSQAGTGPNDLVAVVISDKTKWKFGIVRIAVDIGFAAIGFILGGTVGVGTVICLAVVGPVAQIFMPLSERICGRFLNT